MWRLGLLLLIGVSQTLSEEWSWSGKNETGRDQRALEPTPVPDDQVLQANETQPRHFIKDRLCDLGLGCDDDEEIVEKRPGGHYVHPSEVIYAQPVTLKPVGRPIPAVPVKGPIYGIPSLGGGPIPPHGPGGLSPPGVYRPGFRPTRLPHLKGPNVYETDRDGYLEEKRPYGGPIGGIGGPIGGPHGVGPLGPGSLAPTGAGGLQTHVHHHFHHGEKDGVQSLVDGGRPIAPVYEGPYAPGYAPGSSYSPGLGGFAQLGGRPYDSSLYKRKLNLNKPQFNGNQLNGNFERYPPYDNGRGEDCYCVPYDQCPEIGRKEDLLSSLIDPRNNPNSEIEAETETVVLTDGNGTQTVVKRNKNETKETSSRRRRDAEQTKEADNKNLTPRQAIYNNGRCGPREVCCRRPARQSGLYRPQANYGQCGVRNAHGVNGRIKNPVYVDGDSEFGEYPWQVAILKKDPQESVYVCGGTLIDNYHIITAAHCIKSYTAYDLRVRLGEWDVNHDVEFFPYEERDISNIHVHPEFYAGTLYNDIAVLRMDRPVDTRSSPHISPACLPDARDDYSGSRCWTTGWGKDAWGDHGKYQNVLKEVDVPVLSNGICQSQLQQTRLGYDFKLHPGFICAGGEEGKDACKGDGGGPMVCERGGLWQVVGIVSWGVGCGQYGVPGVYVKVASYLPWIRQVTQQF